MSILVAGGELGALTPSDSGVTEENNLVLGGHYYDTNFARCSIDTYSSSEYAEAALSSGQTDVWVHLEGQLDNNVTTAFTMLSWLDAGGTERVRLRQEENPSGVMTAQYWDGSAWQTIGTATVSLKTSRQTIDLHVICNSTSGTVAVYIGGTERISSASVDLSGATSLKTLRVFGGSSNIGTHLFSSQHVIATESTIGMRVFTVPVSGTGASADFTGTYANIDEAVVNDADFINSGTANQVSTFTATAPTLTGYVVRAVVVAARAKRNSASGPQNLQLALRSSGTNYFSSSKAVGLGYGAFVNVWETDPATSAAWVNTAISSLQPGVKSIA
jgi:hypothetical protein